MDAVKFIEEARRRYKVTGETPSVLLNWLDPEYIVKEVEEWSAAHPIKTRQTEALKMFPNIGIDEFGIIYTCPAFIDTKHICPRNGDGDGLLHECAACRKQYWCEEIKQER